MLPDMLARKARTQPAKRAEAVVVGRLMRPSLWDALLSARRAMNLSADRPVAKLERWDD
jgi:hypothetical protein